MEIDKRPFFIWLSVILANIGMYLTRVVIDVYSNGVYVTKALFEPVTTTFSIVLGMSLIVSIIPIWLSGSNFKWRNKFGFGIFILLLLPVPYFIWEAYHCVGKFCDIGYIVYSWLFGLSAVIFALFYFIGIYFRKWNVKVVLSFVWIESILLLVTIVFLGYYYINLDSSLATLKSGEKMTPAQIVKLCDSFPEHSDKIGDCWTTAMKENPGVDVCSWTEEGSFAKQNCLSYINRTSCGPGCWEVTKK